MARRPLSWIGAGALAALCALACSSCAAPAGERALGRHAFETDAMGTRFRLVLWAPSAADAEAGAEAAFVRLRELDRALSDYDPASELSRLSAASAAGPTAPVPLGADLARVLAAAQRWSERTGGAFDVTVGPYVRLWRRAARQGELPSAARLAQAARAVGWTKLALDEDARTARLLAAGMRLDLGGIAKGYALDEMLAVLRARGIERALVDGGGDVAVGAPPPGALGWRVATAPGADGASEAVLALAHAAVATSGDRFRFVELGGARYSHVVDPRTGLGVTGGGAASVVAADGTSADALASALCVLDAEAGLALVETLPGVEALVLDRSGARRASSGFGALVANPAPAR